MIIGVFCVCTHTKNHAQQKITPNIKCVTPYSFVPTLFGAVEKGAS